MATANNPGNNASGSMALTAAPGTTPKSAANTGLSVWQNIGLSDTFSKVLNQPSVRKVLPLILMLTVLVVFLLAYAWMQSTPYRPVMPGLQEADQQAAYESLKTADFKPKIDPATGQLTVPTNRFHEARILLASQGLPKAGTTGMEGLKDQSSMTTSQLMEQVKINTALEHSVRLALLIFFTITASKMAFYPSF
jgi:flagellar M-ring protein FliF